MATIHELAIELRAFHKALLQPARARYEDLHGPVPGTLQLLQLLVQDPSFAWLRRVSELMADLDEMIDAGTPTDEEQGAVRRELEQLLSPAGGELWTIVTAALQDHAEVATAYARVRQLLLRLPPAAPPDEAEALHARHRWAELRRHRSPT
ncbi:MAG: hypothetical protein ABUS79_30730 [Pseudomonadota bacterium]